METTKKEKQFDAVKMMRDIRDKISSETQNMTFDELKAYIKQKLDDNKTCWATIMTKEGSTANSTCKKLAVNWLNEPLCNCSIWGLKEFETPDA